MCKTWYKELGTDKEEKQYTIGIISDATTEQLPWIKAIKGHLEKNGLLSLFLNGYPDAPRFIHRKLYKSLVDQFHQNAFENICQEDSKLRTYGKVKTKIGIEKYLLEIKNVAK